MELRMDSSCLTSKGSPTIWKHRNPIDMYSVRCPRWTNCTTERSSDFLHPIEIQGSHAGLHPSLCVSCKSHPGIPSAAQAPTSSSVSARPGSHRIKPGLPHSICQPPAQAALGFALGKPSLLRLGEGRWSNHQVDLERKSNAQEARVGLLPQYIPVQTAVRECGPVGALISTRSKMRSPSLSRRAGEHAESIANAHIA